LVVIRHSIELPVGFQAAVNTCEKQKRIKIKNKEKNTSAGLQIGQKRSLHQNFQSLPPKN
jgi:elongation factor P--beta-lysine ligase